MDPKLLTLFLCILIPAALFALLLYLDPEVKSIFTVIPLIFLTANLGTTLGNLLSEWLGWKPHDEGQTAAVKTTEESCEKIPAPAPEEKHEKITTAQDAIPNIDLRAEDDYFKHFSMHKTLEEYSRMREKRMMEVGLKPPKEDNEDYAPPLTAKEIEDITTEMEKEIVKQYFSGFGKVREAYLKFDIRPGKKDISPKCCKKVAESVDKVLERLGVIKLTDSYVHPSFMTKGNLGVRICFTKNNS